MIDDAALILSELLSNACRHARPLSENRRQGNSDGSPDEAEELDGGRVDGERAIVVERVIEVGWDLHGDGLLTVRVTDGGGPTRPRRSSPSLTARGGRGLSIVGRLASEWGVSDDCPGEVTVWAALPAREARRAAS